MASTGTAGTISNNAPVEFPTPTGAGWGTPTNWALMTAPTGGAMEIHAPITTPKAIAAGAPVSYPAGTLTISMA